MIKNYTNNERGNPQLPLHGLCFQLIATVLLYALSPQTGQHIPLLLLQQLWNTDWNTDTHYLYFACSNLFGSEINFPALRGFQVEDYIYFGLFKYYVGESECWYGLPEWTLKCFPKCFIRIKHFNKNH